MTMRFGFTLAEVLITLGIIGVVAAITIPTLVKNYQNQIFVNSLKSSVNIFSNGFKQIIINTGCDDLICTGLFPKVTDNNYYIKLDNAMKNVFKNLKSCIGGDECDYRVSGLTTEFNVNEGVGSGHANSYSSAGEYKYVLPNGVIFYLANYHCEVTPYLDVSTKIKNACANIVFDVNGKKLPNKWGRDIFMFVISQDGNLYPDHGIEIAKFNNGSGWKKSSMYWKNNKFGSCLTTTSSNGYGCAARIIENGWKMDY